MTVETIDKWGSRVATVLFAIAALIWSYNAWHTKSMVFGGVAVFFAAGSLFHVLGGAKES